MAVISSPLAKSLQGGLVQRVSGSAFGGGRGIGPIASPDVGSNRGEELLESNTETLTTISSSLASISSEIQTVRSGIDSIATRLASESRLEQASARAEEEYQKRLAERQIRSAGETQLENKIQAALTEPVQKIQKTVSSVFGRVMDALGILFLGWLTNQGIDAIKAAAEGNIEKLKEIGKSVVKTFGFLVGSLGAFSLLKAGIFGVIRIIGSLAARVGKFVISGLFVRPFQLLINAMKNRWSGLGGGAPRGPGAAPPGPKPPGPKGGPKGKGPGIFGAAWAAVESFMNFKNGEYVDAVMPIAAAFGPGKFVKGLFAAGYAADQIAEIFGTNIFGKDPNKEKEAKQALEEESKSSTSSAQTQPTSKPQSSLMGDKKDDKKGGGVEATTGSIKSSDVKESPDSGVSVPPGTSGSSTSSVTPQTTKAPTSNALSLTGSNPSTPQMQGAETKDVSAKTDSAATSANITPAPTQPADVKAESLGPETKKPTTVIAQVPSAPPKQQAAPAPSAGTNTPSIRSSNPDNFYALYSQFNYNVVI